MFSFVTNFLEPFACLIYLIASVFHYKRQKQKNIRILSLYYLIATLLLSAGSIWVKIKVTNLLVYELLGLATSVFLGVYFFRLLQTQTKKKIVVLLTGIYLVYAVVHNITLEGQRLFDSIGYSMVSATITLYVFMYFHQVLKNVSENNIFKDFNFWLSSGYLIYFAGNFIIFVSYYYFTTRILATYTSKERRLLTALWGMHNVLLFIGALSLLIGCLWINSRRKLASS